MRPKHDKKHFQQFNSHGNLINLVQNTNELYKKYFPPQGEDFATVKKINALHPLPLIKYHSNIYTCPKNLSITFCQFSSAGADKIKNNRMSYPVIEH